MNFQMFKLVLEKAEEPEIKLPTSTEKAREFQKNIYFCFIDYAKAFDCVDHNKLWKVQAPWTAAYQAPPSVEFSRQEYWSGVPLPSPFDLYLEVI